MLAKIQQVLEERKKKEGKRKENKRSRASVAHLDLGLCPAKQAQRESSGERDARVARTHTHARTQLSLV